MLSLHLSICLVGVLLVCSLHAAEPKELQNARQHYEQGSDHSEAARTRYMTRLVRMREKYASLKTDDWQSIDAEIRRHPGPISEPSQFSKLLVGKWRSPRHDYLYRPDGTWTMLPEQIDGVDSTHGLWRIEGDQSIETVATNPPTNSQYTILLLTQKDFVVTDGYIVFYRTRL